MRVRMEREWNDNGTTRTENGTNMEQEWNDNGTIMEQEWNMER